MQCGSTWYQPQYQGSNVTYVVVNQPDRQMAASVLRGSVFLR